MTGTDPGPSRWYYALAVVLCLAGAGLAGISFWRSIVRVGSDLTQMVAPGARDLRLAEPGNYSIYLEYRSVVGNRVYVTEPHLSGLEVALTSRASGAPVALQRPSGTSTYTVQSREGVAVFNFHIEQPGLYQLAARYPAEQSGPEVVLAVGRGLFGQVLGVLVRGFALLAVFGGIGVAIAVKTDQRRRHARAAAGVFAGNRGTGPA